MGYRRRLLLLFVLVAGALLGIWARAFHVMVLAQDRAVAEAAARGQRSRQVMGTRGRILDAAGEVLAEDRTVVRLVFVPGEWATRERFRCRSCGAVAFRTTPRYSERPDRAPVPPGRCTCGAGRDAFEGLLAEDLGPLEEALRVPPGTLAAAADDRMEEIAELVEVGVAESVLDKPSGWIAREAKERKVPRAQVLEELRSELEAQEFRVEDLRRILRADWYGRPTPMTSFRNARTGSVVTRKAIDSAAEALIEGDRAGRYRGWRAEPAVERWYPQSPLLAHVTGYVGKFSDPLALRRYFEERGERVPSLDVRVGRMGLEAFYEDALRGVPGRIVEERDEAGVFSRRTVREMPERGEDLRLHLRVSTCREAQRLLQEAATPEGYCLDGPPSAGFLAMDAETGAVLAWAETPSFDLNGDLSAVTDALERADEEEVAVRSAPQDLAGAKAVPGAALSRVARIPVEPGSSLKILTALALLHAGHPLPEAYTCWGPTHRSERDYPSCHIHQTSIGVEEALAVSCNRWFADTASAYQMDPAWLPLHARLLPEWAARVGIGQRPPIDYPSRPPGHYRSDPRDYELRQMSIGQAVTATPVQMARLAALVANGHRLPRPWLVAAAGPTATQPGGDEVALAPAALARLRAGLRLCVTQGTARKEFDKVALPRGVEVSGKTGTATATGAEWSAANRRAPPAGSVREVPQHLWFVGYAREAGGPTIAFAVVLHGRWEGMGGDVAAGFVARWLQSWYGAGSGR